MAELAYSHDVKKLADGGLQLNLPPDLVPSTQYAKLSNAVSRIEGRLDTRDGTTLICNGFGPGGALVHSIFRLVQVIPSVFGARLFGISTQLWAAPLPAGNVPSQLTQYIVANVGYPAFPVAFSGGPLSIASYRYDGDPQVWAIIANGAKMMKYKAGYYEQLGLPFPTIEASATAGSSGNLFGVYDWRYTYWNSVTLSESNPSPTMSGSGAAPQTLYPTTFTNPDPGLGGVVFTNPADAYDGNPATYAEGRGGLANAGGFQTASCNWHGWSNAGPYTALVLNVTSYATVFSISGGVGEVQLYYSLDGGVTWTTIYQVRVTAGMQTRPEQTDSVVLSPSQDLSQLQVRMLVFGQTFANGSALGRVFEINVAAQPTGGGTGSLSLTNQSAKICVQPPTDPQEDSIRLYRRGGTLVDNWWFVSQSLVTSLAQGVCGLGFLEIDDNASDISIEANNTLQLDNDMPVTSVQTLNQTLQAIWVDNGRVLGCGDPNRPEAVYFSKDGNADEWPPQNWVIVSTGGDEMMNGLVYATRNFAFSRERLYTLIPNLIQGVTYSPFDTACRKGLKGRFAFALGEKGIYFVSKDGIYRTVGGTEESIIDDSIRPLFPTRDGPGIDVNGYLAPDLDDENGLRLAYHNGELWFDYTAATDASRQTLVYDERRNRWRAWYSSGDTAASSRQMHYSEPDTDSSLLSGLVNEVDQGGGLDDPGATSISVDVLTGSFDQGQPLNLKEYGNVIIDVDPGGATSGNPLTIIPFINANAISEAAITVTGSGRQRVAIPLADTVDSEEDLFGLNISFGFTWSSTASIKPILYQLDILWRIEPAAVRHWEVPPVALGQAGWWFARDGYVTLRSSATVTMTFTPDNGSPQTITFPSTGGAKSKLYFSLAATKQKVAQFSFNSSGDFRLYADENQLQVRQWVSKLGLEVLPFFGAERGGGAG